MFLLSSSLFDQDDLFLWIVCLVLLVAFLTVLTLYLTKLISLHRKKKAAMAISPDEGRVRDPNEIPEEVLILLLTAAAATVYGETKPKFRVVSFRRIS